MRSLLLALALLLGACSAPPVSRDALLEDYSRHSAWVMDGAVALANSSGEIYCAGARVPGGLILTARHCVEGEEAVLVGFRQHLMDDGDVGRTYLYSVLREIPEDDLALLSPAELPPSHSGLRVSPEDPTQGQFALAIGHPHGLGWTLTKGAVTFPRRENPGFSPDVWTQADVGVGPGYSGGPLLNRWGEIIGIASWYSRDTQSVGGFCHVSRIRAALEE